MRRNICNVFSQWLASHIRNRWLSKISSDWVIRNSNTITTQSATKFYVITLASLVDVIWWTIKYSKSVIASQGKKNHVYFSNPRDVSGHLRWWRWHRVDVRSFLERVKLLAGSNTIIVVSDIIRSTCISFKPTVSLLLLKRWFACYLRRLSTESKNPVHCTLIQTIAMPTTAELQKWTALGSNPI